MQGQTQGRALVRSGRPWFLWFVIAALFTVWPGFTHPGAPGLSHAGTPAFSHAGTPASDVPDVVGTDEADDRPARHVIHISVDGLRADAVTRASSESIPNFYRFRQEGAFTDNARTDFDYSNTLPNHTSQLTGRRVKGPEGHNWTKNSDPEEGQTLHSNKGDYVASVFDVAHDNGLSTGLYASKSKFVVFDQSYDDVNGAEDVTGEDDGRDKIDRFVYDADTEALVETFVQDMARAPVRYSFVHLRDPDTAGHWRNWDTRSGTPYMGSVERIDRLLGRIFELVASSPALAGNTVVILTSDHGGGGSWHNHGNAGSIENYTIPFYVWGAGVERAELYALNRSTRQHPEMGRPGYDAPVQPIRNADAANLSLAHLGLPAVPGSTVNLAMDLTSGAMPDSDFELADASKDQLEDEQDRSDAVAANGGGTAAKLCRVAYAVRH